MRYLITYLSMLASTTNACTFSTPTPALTEEVSNGNLGNSWWSETFIATDGCDHSSLDPEVYNWPNYPNIRTANSHCKIEEKDSSSDYS